MADYWGILSGKQVLFTTGHNVPDRPVTKILSQYIALRRLLVHIVGEISGTHRSPDRSLD